MHKLSFVLKLFAILYWYLVAYFIAMLVSSHLNTDWLNFTVRGEYLWDFEAFFTAIYLVWGIYLWKAAKHPEKSTIFIQFTAWANLAHAFSMIVVGLFRPEESIHLLLDSIVFIIPAIALLYFSRVKP